jgi:hypothetical protein
MSLEHTSDDTRISAEVPDEGGEARDLVEIRRGRHLTQRSLSAIYTATVEGTGCVAANSCCLPLLPYATCGRLFCTGLRPPADVAAIRAQRHPENTMPRFFQYTVFTTDFFSAARDGFVGTMLRRPLRPLANTSRGHARRMACVFAPSWNPKNGGWCGVAAWLWRLRAAGGVGFGS